MPRTLNVGLIGYGLAGRAFHAPLIAAVPRLNLAAIATSRGAEVARDWPAAETCSPQALIDDPAIDLVVVATPNDSHVPLATAALAAGKHVVVDKPLALSVSDAEALAAAARDAGRMLAVFHNRRWDGDFLTVRRLLAEERLGAVRLYEARWDRFRPAIKPGWREKPGAGAGLLADLGPHLVDQALALFGWPDAITADIACQRSDALVDDYFELRLDYGVTRVVLSAASLIAAARPRFAVHGDRASFVKYGLDPQEAVLRAGGRPGDPGFGIDAADAYGTLTNGDGVSECVPTERGDYTRFYQGVADAILDGAPIPVAAADAIAGLRLIEAATRSAAEGRQLPLSGAPSSLLR